MLKSVFIAESVDPEDFYERRVDGHAANEILKIRGLSTDYRIVLTKPLLKRAIKEAADGGFQIFHLSAHGNDEGICLADETKLSWAELAKLLKRVSGPESALVMATCRGGDRNLTEALRETGATFGWVFGSTAEKVSFSDSCLAWSILYNRLARKNGFGRPALKATLTAVNAAITGDFVYRRWDDEKGRYLRFPSA
ncbi:hypothetical protein PX699_21190 [Sphingobium sp. H39-3-25]|uniref:hypothetical protein n=1 Tax=Sphingobium arseniciresistens TaxID=3030834 RepID=UPI0023B97E08|nr:hypothetical protein [Sphingobium arseniciresistens]